MPSAFLAEPRELLILVTLTALANQVRVRILSQTRLRAFATNDAKPLLRQVLTRT